MLTSRPLSSSAIASALRRAPVYQRTLSKSPEPTEDAVARGPAGLPHPACAFWMRATTIVPIALDYGETTTRMADNIINAQKDSASPIVTGSTERIVSPSRVKIG